MIESIHTKHGSTMMNTKEGWEKDGFTIIFELGNGYTTKNGSLLYNAEHVIRNELVGTAFDPRKPMKVFKIPQPEKPPWEE